MIINTKKWKQREVSMMLLLAEKSVSLNRRSRRGVMSLKETPSVREIEKMLGFDSVMPINATPSDSADMIDKDQELKDWYEDELKKFFAESQ
jgi:hypothetical protein